MIDATLGLGTPGHEIKWNRILSVFRAPRVRRQDRVRGMMDALFFVPDWAYPGR